MKNEEIKLAPEVQQSLQRIRAQSIGYINFMRWANRFAQDELKRHPNHREIMLLSPQQCLRFALAVHTDTTYLGVQDVEVAWLGSIPFDTAYVGDRLYLVANAANSLNLKVTRLGLGFSIADKSLLERIKDTRFLQMVRIVSDNSKVVVVKQALNDSLIPVKHQDILTALYQSDQTLFGLDAARQAL